jgi:hypothetical protein
MSDYIKNRMPLHLLHINVPRQLSRIRTYHKSSPSPSIHDIRPLKGSAQLILLLMFVIPPSKVSVSALLHHQAKEMLARYLY